jgi:hypothetical protein
MPLPLYGYLPKVHPSLTPFQPYTHSNIPRYILGDLNSDSTISHKDAASLFLITNTIGDNSAWSWEIFTLHNIYNRFNQYNLAFQLLNLAYLMTPAKESFIKLQAELWKVTIWNTYRRVLFHTIDHNDHSTLAYTDLYNISNQLYPNDLLYPFHEYLAKGCVPMWQFDLI